MSSNVHGCLTRVISEANTFSCTSVDVHTDVISFVIRRQASGNIRNRGIGPLVSVIKAVGRADLDERDKQ
jgi:hypothetical protein